MKSPVSKIFRKKNLLVVGGGLVLAFLLLLPQRQSQNCPQGKTEDAVIGGSCSSFTDQNDDGLCDLVQNINPESFPPVNFDFSQFPELLVFLLFLTGAIFLNLKKPKNFSRLRLGLLIISLIYFGFLLNQALCPIATLQMVAILKDKLVLTIALFLVFFLPLLTTLLWGKIFCRFLCPLGAVQELVFRIPRWLFKIPVITKIPRFLFYFPYLILFLVLIVSTRLSTAVFCRLDPFGALFSCNPASWKTIVLITLLSFSLFLFRPFCSFLCPLRAIFKFLSQFQILKKEGKSKQKAVKNQSPDR